MNKKLNNYTIEEFIKFKNSQKKLFTAGPSSLSCENIIGLDSCFGRSDEDYKKIEKRVLKKIQGMTGKEKLAALQGSGTLALEIGITNFLYGKVLLINTGYYSERLENMIKFSRTKNSNIKSLEIVNWDNIYSIEKYFDWIVGCSVETSIGLKLDIKELKKISKKTKSKLFLDAIASFGLESDHDLADLLCFSSCKGLFGLTGGSFIAFDKDPENEVSSFYLNVFTHLEKKVTGPYHTILSLDNILKKHQDFKHSVFVNKEKFLNLAKNFLVFPLHNQPLLCTAVNGKVKNYDEKSIPYKPRDSKGLDVVCHLGEVHLGKNAKGNILNGLFID